MKSTLSFILISCTLLLSCVSKKQNSYSKDLSAKIENGKLLLVYRNVERIVGISPVFEVKPVEFAVECLKEDGVFEFVSSEKSNASVQVQSTSFDNIIGISIQNVVDELSDGKAFSGVFVDSFSGFSQGVQLWRYKPWNSWTKPIRVNQLDDIKDWDVQFFYWQYDDGVYGAAIPISGNGYRTTLGNHKGRFGSKSLTYAENSKTDSIPAMAIGFGDDPSQLFRDLYQAGMQLIGKTENLRVHKEFPEAFEYIGWCTWNSSHNGQDLNEEHLLAGVKTFKDGNFPLGWLLIDDGWFNETGRQLNSIYPDEAKFPNGFKKLVDELKSDYQLKHVGLWHAYNGYWNGINPESLLGEKYHDHLFSWKQKTRPDIADAPIAEYHFIKPDSPYLLSFYKEWHTYMKSQGISMIKVDNQLVSEKMCVDNMPIWDLSDKMHQALYESAFDSFNGAVINCMDMTNEAFYNFGRSAIARCVEDYFPERDGGIGYELERGGAAAHVLAALYNSLYFSQLVWPDFDMFESHNTFANFHVAARAISGGPVYVTDIPGEQNFESLLPLVNSDGRIYRLENPGQLMDDCLFQLQDAKPIKVVSVNNGIGYLAAFNAADTSQVKGSFSVADIKGLEGDKFLVYEHFSKKWRLVSRDESLPVRLSRMQVEYYLIMPLEGSIAALGNVNKLNAPQTLQSNVVENNNQVIVRVDEPGLFAAYSESEPRLILVNGKKSDDFYSDGKLFFVPVDGNENEEAEIVFSF